MWLEQDKLFWFAVFISKPRLGHSTIFRPSNWNFSAQSDLNLPILLFGSRRPMHKALRTVEGSPISVLVHWMTSLECTVLLEATYGLPLSIFYLYKWRWFSEFSFHGFVTSVFLLGSTFGILNLFLTMNSKVTTTEGFEPPIFWFEVRRLIR